MSSTINCEKDSRVVLSPPIPFLWAHSSHSGNYEFIVLIFFNLLGCVLVVRIRKKLFGHLPGMFKCHIIGSYHMKKLFRRTKSNTVFYGRTKVQFSVEMS